MLTFQEKLAQVGRWPLRAAGVETLQVNLGKLCNQTCRHCHVDAGPTRSETMTRETAERVLDVLRRYPIPSVDLSGGAPELNPNFEYLVEEARALGRQVIDRSNLTVFYVEGKQHLPEFLRDHQVEVLASLPCYLETNVDAQRGKGVCGRSIEALQWLNRLGYGQAGTSLKLNLVYNPLGPFTASAAETAGGRLSIASTSASGTESCSTSFTR
jgi:radical SAM/Cys-rich protein